MAVVPLVLATGVSVLSGCDEDDLPRENGVYWQCTGAVILPGYEGENGELSDQVYKVGDLGRICANPDLSPEFVARVESACKSQCEDDYRRWGVFISGDFPFISPTQKMNCEIEPPSPTGEGCAASIRPGGGGPALYVAEFDLSESTASVSVPNAGNATTRASGYIRFSIPKGCTGVCPFFVADLLLNGEPFDLRGPVTDLLVRNEGSFQTSIDGLGAFALPAGTFLTTANFKYRGRDASIAFFNQTDLVGSFDQETGAVSLNGTFEADGSRLSVALIGRATAYPPEAAITAPATVECSRPGAGVARLDGSGSVADVPITQFWWTAQPNRFLGTTAALDAVLPLGLNDVELLVTDAAGGADQAVAQVRVVDASPPTVTPSAPPTRAICSGGASTVPVPLAAATDVCATALSIAGQVVSRDGQPILPPLVVTGAQASLSEGDYVVRTTATDPSGNTGSATSQLFVRTTPVLYAAEGLDISDRVDVRRPDGGPATVATRSGLFTLGADSRSGNVYAGGATTLRSRARVRGVLTTASAIDAQAGAAIEGGVHRPATLVFADFPTVAATFPPNAPNVNLEPDTSRTLVPGEYASIIVKSRAILRLPAGRVVAREFRCEPDARVILESPTLLTSLVTRDALQLRCQIESSASFPNFLVEYAGDQGLTIDRDFRGRFAAPRAPVTIAPRVRFEGSIAARQLKVEADAQVIQRETGCP